MSTLGGGGGGILHGPKLQEGQVGREGTKEEPRGAGTGARLRWASTYTISIVELACFQSYTISSSDPTCMNPH